MGVINNENLGYLWNKIGSAVKTAVTGYIGEQTTYTQTPQKVGTWIDGNSIYRIAFNKDINVSEYIDEATNTFQFAITELIENILNNNQNMFIINEFVCIRYDSPCIVDDIKLNYTNTGWWECNLTNMNTSENGHDGIFGWIEFVTSEDNFK